MVTSRALHTKTGLLTGVKVFTATRPADRLALGDQVTEWLARHRDYELSETIVTQSSDSEYHCLSITLFFRYDPGGR